MSAEDDAAAKTALAAASPADPAKPFAIVGRHGSEGAVETDSTDELRHRIERVARDLMTLEVNTIVKESMTATSMPRTAHALLDIVNDYQEKLTEIALQEELEEEGDSKLKGDLVASFAELDRLRTRAKTLSEELGGKLGQHEETPAAFHMLCRIRDNCDQLKGLFQDLDERAGEKCEFTRRKAPAVHILPDEVMMLRKIWEIGTEEIVLQTVIHLSGDLTTRIQRSYAKPEKRAYVEIHQTAVGTSMEFWKTMVDTVGAFIEGVGSFFFRK
jgi:hypothetical protein